MTSTELRKERRYYRRKLARIKKKQRKYGYMDNYEFLFTYKNLINANKKSKRNVGWKSSVQNYQMNLLRNTASLHDKLSKQKNISRGFVEFDLIERGKKRHIKSVHYSERVVQRSVCDNALVPLAARQLIYDNGACLPGKGVDKALRRFETHLRRFYRENNFSNQGYGIFFDFSSYFDNILHSKCFDFYDKLFDDEKIKELLKSFIIPFGVPLDLRKFQMKSHRNTKNITGYRAPLRNNPELYTGISLGLGSQVSQVTAVSYANDLDQYIKHVLRVKNYGRYMDDGYLFEKSKDKAKKILNQIISFCKTRGMIINEKKTQIIKLTRGFTFLKVRYRMYETGKIVKKVSRKNLTRCRRRLKKFKKLYDSNKMTLEDIKIAYGCWQGYALHRGSVLSYRNMNRLFSQLFHIPAPKCSLKKKKVYI